MITSSVMSKRCMTGIDPAGVLAERRVGNSNSDRLWLPKKATQRPCEARLFVYRFQVFGGQLLHADQTQRTGTGTW